MLEDGQVRRLLLRRLLGIYDIHGGSFDTYVRRGGQISYLDPMVVFR